MTSLFLATAVTVEQRTSPNHAFVTEAYLKNGDSVVTTRLFRAYVNIARRDSVSGRNTVKHGCRTSGKELQPFKDSGKELQSPGRIPTAKGSENVAKGGRCPL